MKKTPLTPQAVVTQECHSEAAAHNHQEDLFGPIVLGGGLLLLMLWIMLAQKWPDKFGEKGDGISP